jgi:hypothetical protein
MTGWYGFNVAGPAWGMIFLLAATATSARAQTGRDLLGLCISKDPIQQTSCTLYISGFLHGLEAAEDLKGEICIPKGTPSSDAKSVFVETLAYAELAAALNTGSRPDVNKFFTEAQNAALAAVLAMKFGCPHSGPRKTRSGK